MTPARTMDDAPAGDGRAAAAAAFRVCRIWSMDAPAPIGRARVGRVRGARERFEDVPSRRDPFGPPCEDPDAAMRVSQSWEDAW